MMTEVQKRKVIRRQKTTNKLIERCLKEQTALDEFGLLIAVLGDRRNYD